MEIEIGPKSSPEACRAKAHAAVKRGEEVTLRGVPIAGSYYPSYEVSLKVVGMLGHIRTPQVVSYLERNPPHLDLDDPFLWHVSKWDPILQDVDALPARTGEFMRPTHTGGTVVIPSPRRKPGS